MAYFLTRIGAVLSGFGAVLSGAILSAFLELFSLGLFCLGLFVWPRRKTFDFSDFFL